MTRIDTNLLLEILAETPATQNIMLAGKHGIGKSQILEKYFTEKGYKVVTLFLGQMSDPGDLIGIPHKNEVTGHTEFMPPYWFPTDNQPVVLFLDELNRARPEVLQTIMDLALNRKLAGRSLPEGSRIISAVNSGDEYQLTDLDPALVSRFNIYEFVPSVQDWLLWAKKIGLDERVVDFITMNNKYLDNCYLNPEDLDNLEKTPDRRAWQRVSEIINGKTELKPSYKSIIAGIIGEVAASNFFEFVNKRALVTGQELLNGDFEKILKKITKYTTPQLAALNDSIFIYLEADKSGDDKKKHQAENLNAYIDFLTDNNYREALAHFTNNFTASVYPNALLFIITECGTLYSKLTSFVASIK